MNIDNITKNVCGLVLDTGNYIRQELVNFDIKYVEVKGKHDYVTFVDKNSEKKLSDGLFKILPEAGFITEENTRQKKGLIYDWIIDPLDGTTNFIHRLPPFAISVALTEKERIIIGVVYEINSGECFYANIESPTFLNNREIHVSKTDSIDQSLIATGFPYYEYQKLAPFMKTLEYFFKNSRGVRRLGSAATDLAYVACGRFDCFYEYNLNSWDVAAGALLVQQAGGKVFDFDGGENYLFGKEIIAANSILSAKYLDVINNIMTQK